MTAVGNNVYRQSLSFLMSSKPVSTYNVVIYETANSRTNNNQGQKSDTYIRIFAALIGVKENTIHIRPTMRG